MTDTNTVERDPEVLSMDRAISFNLLRAVQGLVVKVAPGSKRPAKGWDPRSNSIDQSRNVIQDIEYTNDNFGIHLTGPIVDVDVDTDNPVVYTALDEFLPPCQHIWGRKSKPMSHRLYQLESDFNPTEFPFLKKLQTIEVANMELRGGPVSRGEYTLMPGSIHTSGEAYEWHDKGRARTTPSIVKISDVVKAVRKAAAVAVLSEYFTEGVRQKMTMALGGFMQRVHRLSEETEVETMLIDLDEAVDLLRVLLDAIDDDHSDRKDRIKAFKMSWAKGEEGKPVTGATTIAEISDDPTIVRTLYVLLSDNPDIHKLEKYLERYAIWTGPGLVIDMEKAAMGHVKPIMTRHGFINSFGHEFVQVGDRRKQIADAMFTMPNTMRVDGMIFDPAGGLVVEKKGENYINQWSGFEVPPYPGEFDEEDIRPFIDYLYKVICAERDDVFAWVSAWIADIFKTPQRKPGTALVIVGTQGAGKSFLGDGVINKIIGDVHTATVNELEKVTAKHNANMANKIFIQCDEATNHRQRSTTAKMKSLITERRQWIEPKNVDAYPVDSFTRYMLTSNDEHDAIHLPDGISDRRFTVIKARNDHVAQEAKFWGPFVDWISNPEILAKIHAWFRRIDVPDHVVRRCLTTPEKVNMVTASWDPFDGWLTSCVSDMCMIPLNLHTTVNVTRHEVDVEPDRADRSRWARYCSLTHLYRGYNQFSRSYRNADELPLDLIHKRLVEKGLAKEKMITVNVKEYDDRNGVSSTVRYKYVEMVTREQIGEYLKDKLGWEPSSEDHVDDNENGDDNERFTIDF